MDLVHHLLERIEAEFLPKTAGTLLRQVSTGKENKNKKQASKTRKEE